MPLAAESKFQVSLCQPAEVVNASVSTALVRSELFSTFRRIAEPAADAHTFAEIVFCVLLISEVPGLAKNETPDQAIEPFTVFSAV